MFPPRALRILAIGLLMALPGPRALAQPGQVVLEPTTPRVEATPRGVVTLAYQVTNETGVPVSLIPRAELPEGWRLLVPPASLDLESGSSRSGLFMVFVPPNEQAGEHPVLLHLQEMSGLPVQPARFLVRVASLEQVEAVALEAPTYAVAGQTYEARFLVRNTGNTAQQLVFGVRQTGRERVTLEPQGATLAPGESQTVTARVQVTADRPRPTLHVLTLTAAGPDGRVKAQASVKVEAIPRTPPESLRYHTFPVRLRLEPEYTTAQGLSLDWRLSGAGRVSDRDAGLLTLDLQETGAYAAYRRSGLALALGRQRFGLSPLTEPGETASGVAFTTSRGPWELSVYHHGATGTEDGQGPRTGIRASHRWASTGERLSLQALAQPELSGTLFSVGLEKPVTDAWRVGAEIGLQTDPAHPSGAVRVETSWARLPFSGRLSWEHSDAGYRGQAARDRAHVVSSLLLGREGYLTLSWEEIRQIDPVPAENSREQRLTLQTGRLLERTSWGVRYSQARSEQGSSGTHKEEQSLRLHLSRALNTPGTRLLQSVEWRASESSPTGGTTQSAGYQVSLRLPVLEGGLTPYVGFQAQETTTGSENRWRAGARLDQRLSRQTSLALRAGVEQAQELEYRVWGSITHRLANQADLAFQAERRWTPAGEAEWTVKLGLTLPLPVPLGLRSDVGELEGRLVGEEGEGLPGLVVRVNGYAATTDAEGRFRFPALPEGTAVLTLSADQLGPERLTRPEIPFRVEIVAGEKVEQTFQVVRAASVRGQIAFQNGHQAPAQAGVVLGEGNGGLPNGLRGTIVELRNHEIVLRRVTDPAGRFHFERVPPGEWTVVPLTQGLNGSYRIDPGQVALQLDPGEDASVHLALIPLERRIRFIEEGVLNGNGVP